MSEVDERTIRDAWRDNYLFDLLRLIPPMWRDKAMDALLGLIDCIETES